MATTTTRPDSTIMWTLEMVKSRIERMASLDASDEGKYMKFTVQGNGNDIPMTDGEGNQVINESSNAPVWKRIYNIDATSMVARRVPDTKKLLVAAITAEQAGDKQEAANLFRDYLNKITVSFSIPLPNRKADEITASTQIQANVQVITTENGQLVSIDAKSIKIAQAETAKKGVFNIDAELLDFEAAKTPETPATTAGAPAAIKPATGNKRKVVA